MKPLPHLCILIVALLLTYATLAVEEPMTGVWSMAHNGKQRQGWYTGGRALTGAAIMWSNTAYVASGRLWGGAPKVGSPVTDEHYVYVPGGAAAANDNHNIMALDIATGAKVWGQSLDVPYAYGTPVVSPTRVYVSSDAGETVSTIACLDKSDGTIIWTTRVDRMMAGALLLTDGKLLFGSKWEQSGLHCLDANTGTQLWLNPIGTVSFMPDTGPALSPDGQTVYVRHGGPDDASDFIAAIDVNTGSTLWERAYAKGTGHGPTESTEALQPIVDNAGNIYCGFVGVTAHTEPDFLVKFSPTGAVLWTYTFSGDVWGKRGGMALSPDQSTLYVALNGSAPGVWAFDPANGALKWSVAAGIINGSIVVGKDNIIFGVFNGVDGATVKAIKDNGTSAAILWELPVSPIESSAWIPGWAGNPCILTNGDLVVATDYGIIARLTYSESVSPTTKVVVSSTPWWGGTASVTPAGEWFATGSVITLTATALPGARFTGWSGFISSTENPLIITVGVATINVTANFAPIPKPFVDGEVWESFNALWYSDGTWWGPEPNSPIRQLFYTNVDGRSCLAYHLVNSGSNAQLHTEFGMYPHEFSNNTDFVVELWAPGLPAPYTIRSLCKHDGDADHAMGITEVSADGWRTISASMIDPGMPASLLWWLIGGFPAADWHTDKALPAGQTCTFFFDKAYFAGGTDAPWIVDEFDINPSCVGHDNWKQRPRNWRYDTASDYSPMYQNRNYSAVGVDPTGVNRTGLCLVLPFDALQSAENYARAWTDANQPVLADLVGAAALEADVLLLTTNVSTAPVRFWFSDGASETVTPAVNVPAGEWQRVAWTMPTAALAWSNITRVGVMIETTGAGSGILCVDNITFFVPEPGTLGALLGLLFIARRMR